MLDGSIMCKWLLQDAKCGILLGTMSYGRDCDNCKDLIKDIRPPYKQVSYAELSQKLDEQYAKDYAAWLERYKHGIFYNCVECRATSGA